jgi:hypothetical protein
MGEAERTQSIAALMSYVARLQAEGAIEGLPSGRLARVVKLVGAAVEVIDGKNDIPLFADRRPKPDTLKLPTALEWFEQVWAPRVLAGDAVGDDIRGHDQKFYQALASALHRRGQSLSDILPPSPTRGFKPGTPKERAERRRGITRASVRRFRAKNKSGLHRAEGSETQLNESSVKPKSSAPAALPLFRDRELCPKTGTVPTALQWFELVWAPRVLTGEAAGDDIRQHDFKFYEALASALRRRGQKLSDVLPASPTRGRRGPHSDDPEDHRRGLKREQMRRYRAKQRQPG